MGISPETESPLAALGVTRSVLAEFGLETKHALGQNFLISEAVPRRIAEAVEDEISALKSDGTPISGVLEVGPGIGPLTVELCRRVDRVLVRRKPETEET